MNVIAARYASALFALALDKGAQEAVADELRQLQDAYASSPELRQVAASPLISKNNKTDALVAIAEAMKLSDLTIKFIRVLTGQGRLSALPQVYARFLEQLSAHKGAITAQVITADTLDAEEREKIQSMLASATGKTVAVEPKVSPEILGGIVIRMGSTMIDASLTHRLTSLQRSLKQAATA